MKIERRSKTPLQNTLSSETPTVLEPDWSDTIESEEADSEGEPSEEELALSAPHGVPLPIPEGDVEAKHYPTSLAADPIRKYMEDIRKYPLLEPQEEFQLAMALRLKGDVHAAKTLVSANLRLVVKIAFEYRTFYSNLFDLIQEGNIGLMKAVAKFDPTRGARLGYYASWWIRSYILKYLLDNFRLVKVGTTQAQKKLFYHLMREKERLEAQGLLAGPKLLAEKLNVREKDVIEMEQRLSGYGAEMSIDIPVDQSEAAVGKTLHRDLLIDSKESPDDRLIQNELLNLLKEKLPSFKETLNPKEQQILEERLLAEYPKTLQEIATLYGLTRERARQIESKVIEKLKHFLHSNFS